MLPPSYHEATSSMGGFGGITMSVRRPFNRRLCTLHRRRTRYTKGGQRARLRPTTMALWAHVSNGQEGRYVGESTGRRRRAS